MVDTNGSPVEEIVTLDHADLNSHLESMLEGVRLIGEIPLEGPEFDRATQLVTGTRRTSRAITDLARETPALYTYYLVCVAAHEGAGGELWTHVPFAADAAGLQRVAGSSFRDAVKRLGLEDFEAVVGRFGMRNIGPILFHSMIPRQSMRTLLRAVISELQSGATAAHEILSGWRRGSEQFESLKVPAKRFLEYGGEVARDYLERIIDMVRSMNRGDGLEADDFGLLSFVLTEYESLSEGHTVVYEAPKATIIFDPWTQAGLEAVLPATSLVDDWLIKPEGSVPMLLHGHDLQDLPAELPVAKRWVVEGRAAGEVQSRTAFETRGPGVMFFDPNSYAAVRSEQTSAETILALAAPGVEIRSKDGNPLQTAEEYPERFGEWAGYTPLRIDLNGVSEIVAVTKSGETESVLSIERQVQRARLIGRHIPGVTDPDGQPVYSTLPILKLPDGANPRRWRVRLRLNDENVLRGANELPELSDGALSLAPLFHSTMTGQVELRVLGPLGSDLSESFVFVDGLNFDRPGEVQAPSASVRVPVGVSPPLVVQEADERGCLLFEAGQERVESGVLDGGRSTNLKFSIPRLVWALGGRELPEAFGIEQPTINIDDLMSLNLWVRTGKSTSVCLVLEEDRQQRQLHPDGWVTTDWNLGRRRFDLAPFHDAVGKLSSPIFSIVVETDGGISTPVLYVRRIYEVGSFSARYETVVGPIVAVEFDEASTMTRRELRFWSVDAPWKPPIVRPVDDEAQEEWKVPVDEEFASGQYLVELTVGSEAAIYPGGQQSNVYQVEIRPEERTVDERQSAQQFDLPTVTDLEAATDEEAAGITEQAITAMIVTVDPPSGLNVSGSSSGQAAELLFVRPEMFYGRFVRLSDPRIRRSAELRLCLALHLATGAVDVPVADGALSEQDLADLWSISPLLAGAVDLPNPSGHASDRWMEHTGWKSRRGLPGPGKPLDPWVLTADRSALLKFRSEAVQRERGLLTPAASDRLFAELLVKADGNYAEIVAWYHRHARLWSADRSRIPASAIRAWKPCWGRPEEILRRIPGAMFLAALHMVCFTGRDASARTALIDAARLSPRLVERQALVALLHHLADQGRIGAKAPAAKT